MLIQVNLERKIDLHADLLQYQQFLLPAEKYFFHQIYLSIHNWGKGKVKGEKLE